MKRWYTLNSFLVVWLMQTGLLLAQGGLTPYKKEESANTKVKRQSDKYGYLDETGKLVIDTLYDFADDFYNGLALVLKDGQKFYIDATGATKIGPLNCGSASNFSEGLARITVDSGGRYYIDKAGTRVLDVPAELYDAQLFHDGLALVSKQEELHNKNRTASMLIFRFGYMDRSGRLVIPCSFFDADDFNKGVARVKQKNKFGLINPQGKFIAKPVYDYIYPFAGDIARVEKGGLTGFINREGKVLIKPKYKFATDFGDGLAAVLVGDKIGFIDTKGKMVIAPEYEYAEPFSEGYAAVKAANKWGFIDTQGNKFIPLTLEEARGFTNGMAPIKRMGRWGFIDKKGKVVIQAQYDAVSPFSDGLAEVQYLTQTFLINKAGKRVPLKD